MRLIDADALMTKFMDSDLDHLQRDDWREVIQIVTDAPTIEPKTGKWLITMLDHEAFGVRPRLIYCSSCNQCFTHPTRFCPNCGAKMEVQ